MSSICRKTFLVSIAVLAISVMGSASASASECPGTTEGIALCSGGHVLEGTFPFTGESAYGKERTFEIARVGRYICEFAKSKGNIIATKHTVEITGDITEWYGCSSPGTGCIVNPIVFGPTVGLTGAFSLTGEEGQVIYSPVGQNPTAEYKIWRCNYGAEGKVKGTFKCSIRHLTTDAAVHEVHCEAQNSELKHAEQSIFPTSTDAIKLTSGKAFSIQHG